MNAELRTQITLGYIARFHSYGTRPNIDFYTREQRKRKVRSRYTFMISASLCLR